MKPLKIVIISRVIFPKIAPRSMRATELAKEFVRQGHDVTLYGLLGNYDYSNFEKETGVRVRSLGRTYFAKVNSDDSYKFNKLDKFLKRIFGKILEFPDIELMKNTYHVLKKEKDIDLVISVAIPYPIHWGVALYSSLNPRFSKNVTWVADCGDPYMGNPFMKHPFYFKYMEKWFCNKTDFISIPIEEAKRAYFPEYKHKLRVIPQGFNFTEPNLKGLYKKNDKPTFIYSGTFYEGLTKTLTVMFRNYLQDIELGKYKYTRDVHLFYHLLKMGKGYYFTTVFGVYNIHSGGIFSLKDQLEKIETAYKIYKELYLHNEDDFTRYMHFTHTLKFFSFLMKKNEHVELTYKNLFKEAVLLTRTINDFKILNSYLFNTSIIVLKHKIFSVLNHKGYLDNK